MIYNENIPTEYGTYAGLSAGGTPIPYKPQPSAQDYSNGIIVRTFAKKINESMVVEIQSQQVSGMNASLYSVVTINWTISGPRNNVYDGKILTNVGVAPQNTFEISRVNTENGVDLSHALPNPLEFWRGY